jgi:hypothetical protein
MRVMYWNATSPGPGAVGQPPQAKRDLIKAVVKDANPDILCLDEMSTNVSTVPLAQAYADAVLNVAAKDPYVATTVAVNPGAHLNAVVFLKAALDNANQTVKTDFGNPGIGWTMDGTKRDLVRAQWFYRPSPGPYTINIWFQHANASAAGGALALTLAGGFDTNSGWVFIGDFNASSEGPLPSTATLKMTPVIVPPVISNLTFSQYQRDDSTGTQYGSPYAKFKPNPRKFIDFAIASPTGLTIKAANSITLANAYAYMPYGDHFPVCYDLAIKAR